MGWVMLIAVGLAAWVLQGLMLLEALVDRVAFWYHGTALTDPCADCPHRSNVACSRCKDGGWFRFRRDVDGPKDPCAGCPLAVGCRTGDCGAPTCDTYNVRRARFKRAAAVRPFDICQHCIPDDEAECLGCRHWGGE